MQYANLKTEDLFKMWDSFEKVLIPAHTSVFPGRLIPVDKKKFKEQLEESDEVYTFKVETRDKILYIDAIGREKKKS